MSARPRVARIEQIAQSVAEQVEAEHRQAMTRPGKIDRYGARDRNTCDSCSIRPQLGARRLRAEAEIAERGFGEDGGGELRSSPARR